MSLQRHSEEFAAFRGGRDLFAALTTLSACGYEGPLLAEIVNERLAVDKQLQGRTLDPCRALALFVVRRCPSLPNGLAGGTRTAGPLDIEELVIVALVEPAIGMHRAADRVVILEALPYLWPYCLTHEVVHAVVSQYRLAREPSRCGTPTPPGEAFEDAIDRWAEGGSSSPPGPGPLRHRPGGDLRKGKG